VRLDRQNSLSNRFSCGYLDHLGRLMWAREPINKLSGAYHAFSRFACTGARKKRHFYPENLWFPTGHYDLSWLL